MSEGSFHWPEDSVETTHAYVQQILAEYKHDSTLNFNVVFTVGFSEGAFHALGLVAIHPECYAGVLAVSPGNRSLQVPSQVRSSSVPRPMFICNGKREHPLTLETVRRSVSLWRSAGWPVKESIHDTNKHTFPPRWESVFGQAFSWLAKGGRV